VPRPKGHLVEKFGETNLLDFSLIEQIFDLSKDLGESLEFKKHIRKLVQSIADELRMVGAIDQIKLETAILEYISYRKFYFKSLNATEERYVGPYTKLHDKQVKAALGWKEMSLKALNIYLKNMRELEIKYGLLRPNYGQGNTFINQQEVNLKREV
jgi:hypothetical protein